MCVGDSAWLDWSGIRVAGWNATCTSAWKTDTTQTQPHQISNTQRTEKKTTDVVIQQHSRKLLMMDILMSETCWAHKKWNKIASDISLVFYSSTITTMHGPINTNCYVVCLLQVSPDGSACFILAPHSWGFEVTHNDVPQSVGLPWTRGQLVAETSTWQHTHNTQNRQTSMPPVRFERTIPAGERP